MPPLQGWRRKPPATAASASASAASAAAAASASVSPTARAYATAASAAVSKWPRLACLPFALYRASKREPSLYTPL